MKKYLGYCLVVLCLFCLAFCSGCAGTIAAWKDPTGFNKIKVAEWTQKGEASKAASEFGNRPLATMTAKSGEIFTVYHPNHAAPMPVTGEPNAIVQGANVVLNSTVAKIVGGGWAMGYVVGKASGSYTAESGGSINVTRDSGNSIDVETNHAEEDSTISDETHLGSDFQTEDSHADNRTNYGNSTATPTIVEQPDYNDPVIVTQPDPVVVDPAETVVVTQPAPVIVYPTDTAK